MVVVTKHQVQRYPNDPAYMILPVIWVDSSTFLVEHLRYLVMHERQKSRSWLEKSARSVSLLLDFSIVHKHDFESPQAMFRGFVDTLSTGTIMDRDEDDPYSLNWEPRSTNNVNVIISHVTQFSDHVYKKATDNNMLDPETVLLNQYREATYSERLINLAAYHHKKSRAFLNYTFDDKKAYEKSKKTRDVMRLSTPSTHKNEIKEFNADLIFPLLDSFTIPGSRDGDPIENRYNLRNVLITMLMHFGGLRPSEPFHLYIDDIVKLPTVEKVKLFQEDDINLKEQVTHLNLLSKLSREEMEYLDDIPQALVTLYHPSEGDAPERGYLNRKEYLARKYNLLSRNDKRNPKHYYSGWKNPTVSKEGKFAVIHWYPASTGALFWHLWNLYLKHQYISNSTHPFAFVNKNGEPASYSKFIIAHSNALKKLGIKVEKRRGTTLQAHRHAFAQRGRRDGLSAIILQRLLRHGSIHSQNIYTAASEEELRRVISDAYSSLREVSQSANYDSVESYAYRDLDPHGVFKEGK